MRQNMGAVFGKCLGQGKDKNGEQQQSRYNSKMRSLLAIVDLSVSFSIFTIISGLEFVSLFSIVEFNASNSLERIFLTIALHASASSDDTYKTNLLLPVDFLPAPSLLPPWLTIKSLLEINTLISNLILLNDIQIELANKKGSFCLI
jgi:hypothetical protein